jgi:hypothetical protein
MVIKFKAHFDGKNVVPDYAIDLPADQAVEVEMRLLPEPNEALADSPEPVGNFDIMKTAFYGMWADREDMADAVEWVNKERAKWRNRLTRTD